MNSPLASTVSLPGTSQRTSPLRQVFEGSAWNGLAISLGRLAPSFLTILLAWWLDPSELGTLAFVMAYYGVLSLLADWSIAYALQKLIPENPKFTSEITWTALSIRISFSTLLGLLCFFLDVATHVFRGYGAYLAVLLVTSSFGIIVCVYNARCNFALGSFFNIAFQIGWIGIAVILVKFGMHITGPLFALAVSYVLFGLPPFLLDFKQPLTRFSSKFAEEIIQFGMWATLASALAGLATQGGLLTLAYMSGEASAGIYRVAATFGMLPAILGMIIVTPLMPIAKRGLMEGTDIGAALMLPIMRYLLMMGLLIATTAGIFSHSIIAAFARKSYASAAWPMCICLAANVFQTLVTAFSGILFVDDGLKDLSKIQGAIALIAVVGSIGLSPGLRASGPAVASLLAWLVGGVLLYRRFARRAPLSLEWGSYLRYTVSACVSAMIADLAMRPIVSARLRCVFGGCMASIVYFMCLWFQRDLGFLRLVRSLKRSVPDSITLSPLNVSRAD